MARTARAVNAIVPTGITGPYTTADNVNGETLPYGVGHLILHVKNANAATNVVTVTDDEGLPARVTVSILTGADAFILLQEPAGSTLQGGGNVLINYSLATATAAAYSVVPE